MSSALMPSSCSLAVLELSVVSRDWGVTSTSEMRLLYPKEKGKGWAEMLLLNSGETVDFHLCDH